MTAAQLIDGTALSKKIRAEVAQRAAALTARGTKPGLAVVLVGDDPASQVYVRNKVKACEEAGLHSIFEKYDASLSEAALLARVAALNADPLVMEHFPAPLRPEESDDLVDRIEAGFEERGWGLWAVEVPGTTPFAGFVGLNPATFDASFTPAVEVG